jgi:hypothetical protein
MGIPETVADGEAASGQGSQVSFLEPRLVCVLLTPEEGVTAGRLVGSELRELAQKKPSPQRAAEQQKSGGLREDPGYLAGSLEVWGSGLGNQLILKQCFCSFSVCPA